MTIFIIILISYVFSSGSSGYAGAAFRYGNNARAVAMANTVISNSNEGFNALSNPALLSQINGREYGISYFSMSQDRSVQVLSFSNSLPPFAGVSLSYVRVGTDNILLKDEDNNNLGSYNHYESYGSISFGTTFEKSSYGISLKAFFNKMPDGYTAKGIGIDFGYLFLINNYSNMGLICKNINSKYSWDSEENSIFEEEIPLIYSIGYSHFKEMYLLSIQHNSIQYENNKTSNITLGLEIDLNKTRFTLPLYFRGGYQFEKSLFSVGFGLPIKLYNDTEIIFDYALDPGSQSEGVNHLLSFRGNFK